MPVISAVDGLSFPTRLGSGDCPSLNIGPLVNRWSTGNPADSGIDICIFDGMAHACHVENLNTTDHVYSGPYVQAWDGASWNLLGTGMETSGAVSPVIATDGTDLFVAYFWGGGGTWHVRIRQWTGSSWSLMADVDTHTLNPGTGLFSDINYNIDLTVVSGSAYATFLMLRQIIFTGYFFQRNVPYVVRSDGSYGFPPSAINDTAYVGYAYGGNTQISALTTSSGRPIGIYSKVIDYDVGSLVFFDLDTLADIYEAPTPAGDSPLVPDGVNKGGSIVTLGKAIGSYGPAHDHILIATSPHFYLTVPEDFSSSPVALDGTDKMSFNSAGLFALDPSGDTNREFWYLGGGNISYDWAIDSWQPGCSSTRIAFSSVNVPPFAPTTAGVGVPISDDCTYGNPFFQQLWNQPRLACDGTYVYVFWIWWPVLTDPGDGDSPPNDYQYIVDRFPIDRDGQGCFGGALHPVFSTRGRGEQ